MLHIYIYIYSIEGGLWSWACLRTRWKTFRSTLPWASKFKMQYQYI